MRRFSTLVRWWSLYLIFPVACGLLWFEHQAPLPPFWHGILLFVSIGVIYGLLALWCGTNSSALERNNITAPRTQLIEDNHPYAGRPAQQVFTALPQPQPITVQRTRYQLALLPAAVLIASKLSHSHQLAERNNAHEQ